MIQHDTHAQSRAHGAHGAPRAGKSGAPRALRACPGDPRDHSRVGPIRYRMPPPPNFTRVELQNCKKSCKKSCKKGSGGYV